MPIAVSCPSCKTSFKVSEQFAGKQGPCPKCKTPIKIPKIEAPAATAAAPPGKAAPSGKPQTPGKPQAKTDGKADAVAGTDPKRLDISADDIKIHAPDTVGPKTSTGRPVIKPILRKETKIELVPIVAIMAGTLLAFAAAWLLRKPLGEQIALRAIALAIVSPALALGGYWFLRDDELEPYRGRALWLRAGLCALIYAALWGGYLLIPDDATMAAWSWIYLAPPFFLIGAGAGYATLDLEIENAFFHYCFYVLVTLLLGLTAGLHMPWTPATKVRGTRTAEASPLRPAFSLSPWSDLPTSLLTITKWAGDLGRSPHEYLRLANGHGPAPGLASDLLAVGQACCFLPAGAARATQETSATSGARFYAAAPW